MATNKATKRTPKSGSRSRRPTSKSKADTAGNDRDTVAKKENAAVKVRMYRQGLGDCFLVTLPRTNDNSPYYLMIDCGVVLGTPDAGSKMKEVVNDILSTTGSHIDLLIATHQHWDHLSGFIQAKDLFAKLKVDQVWLAWTEDPNDELAKKLRDERHSLHLALASVCARMRFGGGEDSTIDRFMEFFGAAGQGNTDEALNIVKGFCKDVRYCLPTDAPVDLKGTEARLFVLGPPHDEKKIKHFNPSKTQPETYGIAALPINTPALAIADPDLKAPYDPIVQIPLTLAQQMPFFHAHYWGEEVETDKKATAGTGQAEADSKEHLTRDQSWRRIDEDWLAVSSNLALQLDSATNNTSLVLAIELGGDKVLLFAADAQVGNWLSWQDLSWTVKGKTITGPDLLQRTHLYKTGHHGSHNATLREKGLELMAALEIALIPVDHDMALKKGWGKIPLEQLEQRLNAVTKGRVLRIDKEVPPALARRVGQDESKKLYYEVAI